MVLPSLQFNNRGKIIIFSIIILILLIILIDITVLLQRNGIIDASPFTGSFQAREMVYKMPNLNTDETITYYLSLSKIESVEDKNFLFLKYTEIGLRPKIGEDNFSKYIHYLQIPTNLKSMGAEELYPNDLRSKAGKQISLWVTFQIEKPKFTFLDIKNWEIKSIDQ